LTTGIERTLALLEGEPETAPEGYLDILGPYGPAVPTSPTLAQRLMLTRAVPTVYERWWRPAWGRLLKGPLGPGMEEERRIARRLLELSPGDGVLDIACGPGNFARDFAPTVGPEGLVVGLDASPTMLARAVRDTAAGNIAYLRADATRLPFRDAAFDAVSCFAALHLFDDPWTALDEMTRVLTPGGRVALLTSCRLRSAPLRLVDGVVAPRAGIRMFERDEITGALEERGFESVSQRVSGLAQFVGASRPPANPRP
jgi:SAM-dependent methyltransferase